MRSILLVHCYDLIYILNTDEILNNEDADNESEKSENEEDTERNPMPTVGNDDNAYYDVGSPKNLGLLTLLI
ncbi:hypothetical protein PS15m_003522 [Mucor circinelloides]